MKILFSGGGTAGHINPALAIAGYICQRENAEIAFVGTKEGLEAELIPKLGHKLYTIKIHGFERKLTLRNFKNLIELPASYRASKKIIKEFAPDIVIGTGGYVCGPVLLAAAKMGIPTLVHESNAYPGVTTRMLAPRVDTVAIGAKPAREYIKNAKHILCTGNPVRPSVLSADRDEARKKLNLDERPFIVIFGGSLGAREFNKTVVDWLCRGADEGRCQVLMGTGKLNQYEDVAERFRANGIDLEKYPHIRVSEYIYDMDIALAAADLVICRAGASTLSELTALGKPSILVPSPYVTANHQEHNARAIEKEGGALVILEKDFTPEALGAALDSTVFDKDVLKRMGEGAKRAGTADATRLIYDEVMRLLSNPKAQAL